VVCYIAHKGGVCVREVSRLEQPVHSAVAETRLLNYACMYPSPLIFLAVFPSHGGIWPSFPIPHIQCKNTPLVSVKIFCSLQREFSVACKGIFKQRAVTFLFFSEELIEIGKWVLTIQLHEIFLSELGQTFEF
jgi:hypothetical protein